MKAANAWACLLGVTLGALSVWQEGMAALVLLAYGIAVTAYLWKRGLPHTPAASE